MACRTKPAPPEDHDDMGTLSSKSPAMAIKEIWVHLLAYNLVHRMMLQAANKEGVEPRNLSFKHALQLFIA